MEAAVTKAREESLPPHHVAIIMDGNGRWARARGLPKIEGHRQGTEAVRKAIQAAIKNGVRYLTLMASPLKTGTDHERRLMI